ncbi:hypothetical protein EC968_007679 [Mortierella alpina]|nr:hypothetical protein EC968_007679 [Mortierella alpina]
MSSSRSPLADRTNLPMPNTPSPATTHATTTARTAAGNSNNNQATGSTAGPTAPASPPPHRVHFMLPSPDHTLDAPHLRTELPAVPWAPSPDELKTATIGVRNAQTMMRCAEASTTLWVSEYFAELSDRFPMSRGGSFRPFLPESDPESDARLEQYTRAIDGCNNIIRGIKRNLQEYAATFDRAYEFGDTTATTKDLLPRYVWHGEHNAKRARYHSKPVSTDDVPLSTGTDSVAPKAVPATAVVVHTPIGTAAPAAPRLKRTESSVRADAPSTANRPPAISKEDRCRECTDWKHLHTVEDCPFNSPGMRSPIL